MAYAVIQTGGKQFRVVEGDVVRVPTLEVEIGSSVDFDTLATGDGDSVNIGTPVLDGVRVSGTVVEHGRGKKIIVFKMKRRKQYKKTHGHRQNFTAVKIESLG
jgi:large subunit ribosomal protein L21